MVKIHSDTHRMSLNTFIQNSQVHILTTRRASCPFMASGIFFFCIILLTHTNPNKMIIELLECSTGSFQQFSVKKFAHVQNNSRVSYSYSSVQSLLYLCISVIIHYSNHTHWSCRQTEILLTCLQHLCSYIHTVLEM